jgi:transposase
LNGLDPEAYLVDVLDRMVSGATKTDQLHELLAWNWKAAREAESQIRARLVPQRCWSGRSGHR